MKLKGGAARRVKMPEYSCFKCSGWYAIKRGLRETLAHVPRKIEVDLQRRPRSLLAGVIYHDLDRVTQVHFMSSIYDKQGGHSPSQARRIDGVEEHTKRR